MKLFHWKNTKVNQLYSHGDIIVMANSLEEAITIAKTQVLLQEYVGYKNINYLMNPIDEDDKQDLNELMKTIDEDLSNSPIVYDDQTAIFINGGE
jgi:hypothetical protein